jgi:3-hydroxybenzoate 6-monooxygenase
MSGDDDAILIVGGGIGGMATALALSRIGQQSVLFEQSEEFKEIGAGIQLGPNAFQMLAALGVEDEIRQLANFPEALVVMDALSGECLTEVVTGETFENRFDKPYGLIHRADLHRVLTDACRRSAYVALHPGQKVVGFENRDDHVEITTQSGKSWRGSALIGADGLWSTIRAGIVGDGPPRVAGHIAYRAVLPAAEVPPANSRNAMTVWLGPKTHLVHYPLRRGQLFNLVAVFHSDRYEEGWDSYGDPTELAEKFRDQRPEVLGILEKIESWRMWVLCDRQPIRDWCRGRVGLLGDAAHPMLQYLAQGAAMSLEDAVCLSNCLASGRGKVERALQAYQAKRYLRTTHVQLMARLYGEAYHASDATRDLRNQYLTSRSALQGYDSFDWMYNPEEVHRAVY